MTAPTIKRAKTSDTKNKVRKFLHQHKNWFALAGTVLFVFTFIAKEGKKEDLRDLVGALENAENSFAIKSQNTQLAIALDDIRSRLIGLTDRPSRSTPYVAVVIGSTYTAIDETNEQLQHLEEVQNNVALLANKLPSDEQRATQLTKCQQDFAAGRAALVATRERVSQILGPPQTRTTISNTEEGALQAAILHFVQVQQDAARDVAEFSTSVLQEAPRFREQKEHEYARWNKASYFLFALGVTLGFIGRLFGIQSGTGG